MTTTATCILMKDTLILISCSVWCQCRCWRLYGCSRCSIITVRFRSHVRGRMVLTVIVAIVVVIVMILLLLLLKNHRPTPSPRMVVAAAVAVIRRSTITEMGTVPITSCRRHGSILIPGAYGGCPIGGNWNVRYTTTTTTTTSNNNIFLLLLAVRTGILRLE
jgi:hypothetical protein